jgi:DNA-binding transcriptional ArsR family regulator
MAAMTNMMSGINLAEIGALVGDVARANMLNALMGGRALTAGELAWAAHVTAQTASGHLAKLTAARLLVVEKQGRHRYFRLASAAVGQMIEGIMTVAAVHSPPRYRPSSRIDDALRAARTCYDHLAGRLGVALTDALAVQKHVVFSTDGGALTAAGSRFLARFGLDLAHAERQRRCFCRPCLDWSERRAHLGGAVGAALATRCFELGWIARVKDSRAVAITPAGRRGFAATFDISSEPSTG